MTRSIALSSASAVTGFALCAIATSGSFNPWPVSVQTIVLPSPAELASNPAHGIVSQVVGRERTLTAEELDQF